MPRPLLVDAGIVLYAVIIGATLTMAARGGAGRMWITVFWISFAAFVLSGMFLGVPIFYSACPLCGFGHIIHWELFAVGTVCAAIVLWGSARYPLSTVTRSLIGGAAALPALWMGYGYWVS